jgi:hypothetical protein
MKINKRAKVVVAAAALIGTVGVASSAFTGTGVLSTVPDKFIGGTISQNVKGAEIDGITYGYVAGDQWHDQRAIDTVTIHFADVDSDGQDVTVLTTGDGGGTVGDWDCDSPSIVAQTAVCTSALTQVDMASIDITVVSADLP